MDPITELLLALEESDGAPEHRDAAYRAVYPRLHAMASSLMRGESGTHTLQPTALVSEAYLRLVGHESIGWRSRAHFFAIAARIMRRILVDHARTRSRIKRGGDQTRVTLHDFLAAEDPSGDGGLIDLVAFDQALSALEDHSERMAKIVEMRVFGGLDVREVAMILGVSERTVSGDWAFASVWLAHRLRGPAAGDGNRP